MNAVPPPPQDYPSVRAILRVVTTVALSVLALYVVLGDREDRPNDRVARESTIPKYRRAYADAAP